MAWGLSKTRYSPIAIDYGADTLKLLQVVPTDPPQMVAAAAVQIPDEVRKDPALRHTFLTETLRKVVKSNGFKGRRAICSIPATQTLAAHFEIAKIEHENIDEQIGIHLRQRLNVDPSRMVIRSFQVGQVVRDGSAKQEILCFAASREAVLRHIETAHRAKLDVVGMHSEHLAMVKAFNHLYRRKDDANRTTCFIDVGGATTKLVIAHGHEAVFAKTIHAAGDHFTRAYASEQEMPFAQAREERIMRCGSADVAVESEAATVESGVESPENGDKRRGSSSASAGLAVLDAQIAASRTTTATAAPQAAADTTSAGDVLDLLIDELQLSVRYHASLFTDRPIEKLVFLGGESRHVALCQKIARALRIGAQLGDPLARMVRVTQARPPIGVDMRQPQPGWAVPMGLCLSEANL
jgi:Tfp pilus assembly PilM family ATPase